MLSLSLTLTPRFLFSLSLLPLLCAFGSCFQPRCRTRRCHDCVCGLRAAHLPETTDVSALHSPIDSPPSSPPPSTQTDTDNVITW